MKEHLLETPIPIKKASPSKATVGWDKSPRQSKMTAGRWGRSTASLMRITVSYCAQMQQALTMRCFNQVVIATAGRRSGLKRQWTNREIVCLPIESDSMPGKLPVDLLWLVNILFVVALGT